MMECSGAWSSPDAVASMGRSRLARRIMPALSAADVGPAPTVWIRAQVSSVVSCGAEQPAAPSRAPAAIRTVRVFFMMYSGVLTVRRYWQGFRVYCGRGSGVLPISGGSSGRPQAMSTPPSSISAMASSRILGHPDGEIPQHGHGVPGLHAVQGGRLDAMVGGDSDDHDVLDVVALQPVVEPDRDPRRRGASSRRGRRRRHTRRPAWRRASGLRWARRRPGRSSPSKPEYGRGELALAEVGLDVFGVEVAGGDRRRGFPATQCLGQLSTKSGSLGEMGARIDVPVLGCHDVVVLSVVGVDVFAMAPASSAPPSTGREPPSQKSFWTSTMIRARDISSPRRWWGWLPRRAAAGWRRRAAPSRCPRGAGVRAQHTLAPRSSRAGARRS